LATVTRKPKVFMMDLLATVPYYTAYLSRSLLKEGVNLTVGSITYYLDPDCFSSRGIKLDPGMLDIVGRFRLPKYPRRLFKLVESTLNLAALTLRFIVSKPDIIHVQFLPMLLWRVPIDLWFVLFLQRRGAKIVLTVHDLLPHDTGEQHKQLFLNLYNRVDAIICHSDHIAEKLALQFGITASKLKVIPHGPFFYDVEVSASAHLLQSFQLDPHKLTFLFQGILLPYKGVDLLLKAWQIVEKNSSAVQLVIAGTGSPELLEELRTQAQQLDLQQVHFQLRFISTDELVALYRAADVVVYPYRAVTTSGALATGLALGKAMVASNLTIFQELLRNEHSALLIDPHETNQFAQGLLRLAAEPKLRTAFSARIVEMHYGDQTWQSIAARTVQTYENTLQAPPR